MILKSYETNKINLNVSKFILLHGKNEGLKNFAIENLIKNKKNLSHYDEKQILENPSDFLESIFSKSLFEAEKIIIIKRASEKIFKIINEISSKKIEDLIIIINTEYLDKKSKLRLFFEKNKQHICVAFYPDNELTLIEITSTFFKRNKISISPNNINLIVSRCNGDRQNLFNELNKIENYCIEGKKITSENIEKLTNLTKNQSISELIDSCLAKNKKKLINILNENNFSNEDCVLITRTLLNKSKKICSLAKKYEINKDLDLTISSSRPPIFWKEKEITKQQVYIWSLKNITDLIYKINNLELIIKKNINNSIYLVTDFILEQAST